MLPLFKKFGPEDQINYRPNLLTGALAKIFEILLRDQILANLEKNRLLATTQFGYRKKVSTIDALLYCNEKIRYDLHKKHRYRSFFWTYQKLLVRYHILFIYIKVNFYVLVNKQKQF